MHIPIVIAHAAFEAERVAHVEKMLRDIPTARVVSSPERVHARVWFRRVVESVRTGPFCMLSDDVDVAPNFTAHLDAISAAAPGRLVALHTTAPAAPSLIMCGERWLSSYWMTGPGMIIPDADELLAWLDKLPSWMWHSQNEDGVLNQFAWARGEPVLHCLPAIVKHRDEIPSTLGYDHHPMRVTDVSWERYSLNTPRTMGNVLAATPISSWLGDWPAPEKMVHVACPWMSETQLARTQAAITAHVEPGAEPRVAFATPSKGGAYTDEYVASLWKTAMQIRNGTMTWIRMRWQNEAVDIIRARARFQDFFLTQTDCTELLWVDDDMQWEPATVVGLVTACREGKDVVGAPYPQKAVHWERVEKAVAAGRHPETFTSNYPVNMLAKPEGDGHCCTVHSIGMGMLCMSRRAVAAIADEAMAQPVESGEWFCDYPSNKKIANSYGFKVDASGQLLSDSHTICWRWRQLAGKLPFADGRVWMYCGPGSPVNHVGKHVFHGYPEGVIGEAVT
jgi:hypothetical protein